MARRPSPEHQEAVARRLALLSAELAGSRPAEPLAHDDAWWSDHTRVVAAPDEGELGAELPVGSAVSVVPVPGRHAARRSGWRVVDAVPASLRGRVALGPAQLAVVATLVAVGLAVTCWWVVRGDAAAVAPLAAGPVSGGPLVQLPAPATGTGDSGASTGPVGAQGSARPDRVTVDVAGKVRHPGIAVLDAGSRVVDALKAAGGARPGADVSSLNLARVLVDGEQIVVGVPPPAGVAASAATAPATPGPLVDLNTATQTELETLPEVGPVTAQAILAWRDAHGSFTSVDELLEVDGLGDATLGQIAPYVTV